MRYFFLAYAIVAVLLVGILGFRGQHFSKPPVQVFPDMDNQDKLKAQAPTTFFADRVGGRQPVEGTQPRGFNEEGAQTIGGVPEYEFGGQVGYYYSGHVGDYFGTGMPEELELTAETATELIKRGEERYGIYCAVCHGESGDGLGITSRYGVPGIANLHLDPFKTPTYPDGRMFEVITNGKGQMGAYGANIPVRDRWAIIAYVRTLQVAKENATAGPSSETSPSDASAEPQEADQ
ncbi:MAG: cytochrome c [Akkermansiaceae bacterium]